MADVVDGFDGLATWLIAIGDAFEGASYEKVLNELVSPMEDLHEQYFVSSTDPNGQPWNELHPKTIKKKGHDTILVETGALFQSLTETGHKDAIRNVSHDELIFGTSDFTSSKHMTGFWSLFDDGWHWVPARKHVGLTDAFVDEITDTVADAAVAALLA